MTPTDTLFGVQDFARGYICDIGHHRDVHTEHLADSVRAYFSLPAFPTLTDLNGLCVKLGIPVKKLPSAVSMDGVNIWAEQTGPEIYVREDLQLMRAETTLCHEIREVIENAFKRAKPDYIGLNTSDNKSMNHESDHFASCLLMQASASRILLTSLGFDLPAFSRESGRSLPSVVLRLQSLYSINSNEKKPHAGVWLFDAPWELAQAGLANPSDMVAKYQAQLCGFSLKKGGTPQTMLARGLFPAKRSALSEFGFGRAAVENREPMMAEITGFDMFAEQDYVVVAQPIFTRMGPWRGVVVAVRQDGRQLFEPWIKRLQIRSVLRAFQSANVPSG
jgi:hypothetical protein